MSEEKQAEITKEQKQAYAFELIPSTTIPRVLFHKDGGVRFADDLTLEEAKSIIVNLAGLVWVK